MTNTNKSQMCSNAYKEFSLYDYVATLEKESPAALSVAASFDWREVVEKNLGLVHSRIGKVFGVNANNREDIEQAGMLALIKAAKGFDPSLGYRFSSYAVPAIDRAMQRELYHVKGCIPTDSLDEMQEEGDYKLGMLAGSDPDEIYEKTEINELEHLVDAVCSQLTRAKDIKAVKAVALQLHGMSPDEIARVSGLSRRSYSAYISIGRQILSANPNILSHLSLSCPKRTPQMEATLLGERFSINTEYGICIDLPARSGSAGGFSLKHFVKIIEEDEVADYLLCEVAIGEEVMIFDEDSKCTTAIRMDTDSAAITDVWQHIPSRSRREQCA